MKNYDLIIIGAGPGGYVAAIRAAQLKAKVCVVEKSHLGGVCLNWGCIPTKVIINSVNLLSSIQSAKELGIEVKGARADYGHIMAHKDKIVDKLRTGISQLFKARAIDLVNGQARLSGIGEVEVVSKSSQERIKASKIIMATGSEPLKLSIACFDGQYILNSNHALSAKHLPASILIIGGGAIGCEFGHIYSGLGSKVTVVEMMDRLLPTEDPEVGRRLAGIFQKKGVEVKTDCRIEKLTKSEGGITAELSRGQSLKADQVLICVGRRPNIQNLGLETIGIKTDKGCIQVNDNLQTSVSGIYAIGDVIGGNYLAHVASYEGILAANNLFGKTEVRNYRVVPNCIFTEPEIASVGLSEEKAKASGYDVQIGKFPFSALGKAHVLGQTEGFVKLIGDAKTDEILGGVVMGPGASSLIAEISLGMKLEATMAEISETIHAHPTLPEAVMEAASAFYGEAIHAV